MEDYINNNEDRQTRKIESLMEENKELSNRTLQLTSQLRNAKSEYP
jgi:hypothetical protein